MGWGSGWKLCDRTYLDVAQDKAIAEFKEKWIP